MFQHQTEYSPEYNPTRNTTIYFFLADFLKCSVCMNFLLITRFTSREETETKGLRALDEYWRLHTLMAELVRFYEGWTLVIQMKVNVRSFWSFTSQNLIWTPGGILKYAGKKDYCHYIWNEFSWFTYCLSHSKHEHFKAMWCTSFTFWLTCNQCSDSVIGVTCN